MLYLIANGQMPTTAALVKVATGTTIKTMLQVKPFVPIKLVEWGFSFDGFSAALPGSVELIETDVAATVTALADADISKYGPAVADAVAPSVAGLSLGVSATGFTASAEGTPTASRYLDAPVLSPPTGPFIKQFPLGNQPVIQVAKFARIRMTFGTSVNAYCYMIVDI